MWRVFAREAEAKARLKLTDAGVLWGIGDFRIDNPEGIPRAALKMRPAPLIVAAVARH